MKFATLLAEHRDEHALERIGAALDAMTHEERKLTMLSIEPAEQRALWKLVKDRPVDTDHFVPPGIEPLRQVIHHGKNSLLAHNFFQKRFCRADDGSNELWGYNHQTLAWASGPGYFVARDASPETDRVRARDDGDLPASYLIDYTRLPPKKPDAWPRILPNERLISRFVYAGMKDFMRRVSRHVSIGRAHRNGRVMNAWFVLCREDPS